MKQVYMIIQVYKKMFKLPTSYAGKYEYEDGSIPTEQEGPLDLTTKNNNQKQHNIFHCQQKEEKEY